MSDIDLESIQRRTARGAVDLVDYIDQLIAEVRQLREQNMNQLLSVTVAREERDKLKAVNEKLREDLIRCWAYLDNP